MRPRELSVFPSSNLPRRLCSDLWEGLVPMPLVLESERPRLEGVEGEVRVLHGEEKLPS